MPDPQLTHNLHARRTLLGQSIPQGSQLRQQILNWALLHQLGDGSPPTCDHDAFASLNRIEQARQMGLGLSNTDLTHQVDHLDDHL